MLCLVYYITLIVVVEFMVRTPGFRAIGDEDSRFVARRPYIEVCAEPLNDSKPQP